MEFTDEIIVADDVVAATETPGTFTFRTCIKVKMPDGSFSTIIPITNTESVLCDNGELLNNYLKSVVSQLSNNTLLINNFDTDLKTHMEEIEDDSDVDNSVFTHIYEEMDTLTRSIQELSTNIKNLSTTIETIKSDIVGIKKDITGIKNDIDSHKDVIV